ncbi:MAG: hypothetical protein HQL74_13205 [Magnetococcales bacterium]|nr:hypothetical protein [Magnetococcales bacterium]
MNTALKRPGEDVEPGVFDFFENSDDTEGRWRGCGDDPQTAIVFDHSPHGRILLFRKKKRKPMWYRWAETFMDGRFWGDAGAGMRMLMIGSLN